MSAWTGGDVAPGVTCVVAPNPSPMTLDGTNTYLVDCATGVAVVDPGPDEPAHVHAILAALGGRPCAGILLTHTHGDHSGAVDALAEATGSHLLAAADTPPELLRHETPGHTSDSVTYVVPGAGLALTGDTVLGRGTTVVAWPDGVLAHYLRSLGALRDLAVAGEFTRIAPGHGPVRDALPVLDEYLAHREQRLEQVRVAVAAADPVLAARLPARPADVGPMRDEGDVLPEEPGRARDLADAVVETVYADVPPAVRRAARVSVMAQLEYLGLLPA